jgi:hypothetical protein
MRRYWLDIHRRALAKTLHTLRLEAGGAAVIAIIVAAIYIALVWKFFGPDAAGEEVAARFFGWLSPLAVFPAVYLWHIANAPAERDRERREEIESKDQKILAASLSRNVSFAGFELQVEPGNHNNWNGVRILLQNTGQEMYSVRPQRLTLVMPDIGELHLNLLDGDGYIAGNTQLGFNGMFPAGVRLPLDTARRGFHVIVEVYYDNLPPTRARRAYRKTRYSDNGRGGLVNTIEEQDETWV